MDWNVAAVITGMYFTGSANCLCALFDPGAG